MNESRLGLPTELITIIREYTIGYKTTELITETKEYYSGYKTKIYNKEKWIGDKRFKHGIYKIWNCKGGVESESPFKYGKLHGIRKEYHASGRLRTEFPYKDGKLHGTIKYWDDDKNGTLIIEETYKFGKIDGFYRRYWRDFGNLCIERPYVNGKKHGLEKKYVLASGRLYSICLYENDKVVYEKKVLNKG